MRVTKLKGWIKNEWPLERTAVLIGYRDQSLTINEIAVLMGISRGMISGKLQRLRQREEKIKGSLPLVPGKRLSRPFMYTLNSDHWNNQCKAYSCSI